MCGEKAKVRTVEQKFSPFQGETKRGFFCDFGGDK